MYSAKKDDYTELKTRYIIYQDGPASFHITVHSGSNSIYDYIEMATTMEEVDNLVLSLEKELLPKEQEELTYIPESTTINEDVQ